MTFDTQDAIRNYWDPLLFYMFIIIAHLILIFNENQQPSVWRFVNSTEFAWEDLTINYFYSSRDFTKLVWYSMMTTYTYVAYVRLRDIWRMACDA